MASYKRPLMCLKPNSSMIISSATGSGKTYFVKRLLENIDFMYGENPPQEILYCYGVYQEKYDEMLQTLTTPVIFHEGLPAAELIKEFSANGQEKIIVIDDLMHLAVDCQAIELLFTQYCHHHKLSVIFIQQNLFPKGRNSRTIAVNAWYMVLFENVRDRNQVACFGRQVYPGQSKSFIKAYADAVEAPWGYLLIDLSHNVPKSLRLRTNIFPGEQLTAYNL